jgi:hypothetical protein
MKIFFKVLAPIPPSYQNRSHSKLLSTPVYSLNCYRPTKCERNNYYLQRFIVGLSTVIVECRCILLGLYLIILRTFIHSCFFLNMLVVFCIKLCRPTPCCTTFCAKFISYRLNHKTSFKELEWSRRTNQQE